MSEPIGAISVSLEGDLSKVVAGFNTAGAAVDRFGRRTDLRLSEAERRFGAFGASVSQKAQLFGGAMARASTGITSMTSALGVGTLAAGAGLAGLVGTLRETAASLAKVGDVAERTGASAEAIQKLRFAVVQTGGSAEDADAGLLKFARNISEAARGGGDLAKVLAANGVAIRNQDGSLRSVSEMLASYANLVARARSPQDQLNLAAIAFGKSAGPAMVGALKGGATGLQALGAQAKATGSVLSNEIVAKAGAIDDRFEAMSAAISQRFKGAVIEGATALSDYQNVVIGVAATVSGALVGRALAPAGVALAVSATGALNAAKAMTALSAGAALAAAASRGLGAALAFLGTGTGIGIAIGVIATGLYVLSSRQNEAEKAADAHKAAIGELDKVIASMSGELPNTAEGLKKLGDAHLKAARAAVEHARAELTAAEAAKAAKDSLILPAFGEEAALAGAEAGATDTRAGLAKSALDHRVKELEALQAKIDEATRAVTKPAASGPATVIPASGEGGKEKIDAYEREAKAIRDKIEALKIEAATVGMSTKAAAAYRAEQDLLRAADEAKKARTPELLASIKAQADALGEQTAATEKLTKAAEAAEEAQKKVAEAAKEAAEKAADAARQNAEELAGATGDLMKGIRDDLKSGASATDAFKNAIERLGTKLEDAAIDNIANAMFGVPQKPNLLNALTGGAAAPSAPVPVTVVNAPALFGGTPLAGPGNIVQSPLPKLLGAQADPGTVAANAAPHMAATGSAMSFVDNYRRGVDPRLTDILSEASKRSGYKVEAFSGFRPGDPRFHGKGLATDVRLIDPASGKALPNYQNAEHFRTYEQFAQTARTVQMERYPQLAEDFRWGGYFGGPKGKYGAVDTMHFDLAGRRTGMGGGSWENGLTPQQRTLWPGAQSQGMAAVPQIDTNALQTSLNQVQTATQQAATAIPQMTTGATAAAPALGGVAQQATGLGGLFQNLLGMGGGASPGAGGGGLGIFALIPKLFGLPFAAGGRVNGPGSSTSDSIPAMLSAGEFVVNAKATAKHAPLLEAINGGGRLRAFARGGMAGAAAMSLPALALASEPRVPDYGAKMVAAMDRAASRSAQVSDGKTTVNVIGAPPGTRVEEREDGQGGRSVDVILDEKNADAMSRSGSASSRALQGSYGARPKMRRFA